MSDEEHRHRVESKQDAHTGKKARGLVLGPGFESDGTTWIPILWDGYTRPNWADASVLTSEVVPEHHVALVVRSHLPYAEVTSRLVDMARSANTGPVEAYDPKKATSELERVTEKCNVLTSERDAAVKERHALALASESMRDERDEAKKAAKVLTRERDTAWAELAKLREANVVRRRKKT